MKRHHLDSLATLRHSIALAVAAAVLCLPAIAPADAIYRWRDDAGRLHYSNRRVVPGAEVAKLPALSIARPARPTVKRSSAAAAPSVSGPPSAAARPRLWGCAQPDPSELIAAVEARLAAPFPERKLDSGLTLFVAGTPVSYADDANVEVIPAGAISEAAASEQAAIAHPDGACPRAPLERYAVNVTEPVSGGSSATLCADFRRAASEIDIALSRNRNVTRTFEIAAAHSTALQVAGGDDRPKPNVPAWVLALAATQSAALADEIDEFTEELTVARDEIGHAAEAEGCW